MKWPQMGKLGDRIRGLPFFANGAKNGVWPFVRKEESQEGQKYLGGGK
jgi:hypothetical protein